MSQTCQKCGAKCCKYFCFEIDEPDTYEEFEDVRWYLCHQGVTVHIDEGDWYISIENHCKKLGRNDHCKIYDERPLICRSYDPSNCDHVSGFYGYDEHFRTPEELDAYARETLGEKEYEKARKKAHAKFEPKKAKKTKKRKKLKA